MPRVARPDRLFGADYPVMPQAGPATEGAPITVSDKLGRMLKALEPLHRPAGWYDCAAGGNDRHPPDPSGRDRGDAG
ncbi:hypothetical protein [Puniceibacterium sp. IMCC21224]|uniref:hypothetical protein n=1 Tax=Puniceibacterium sp. IMCC21224 TaxID=1618204 RepID=UPI0012DFF023|nr:hypothetical protein [Puniceibacterium sp. IMCC21224]